MANQNWDQFAGEEYLDESRAPSYPYLQTANKDHGFGIFVTLEQLEQAGADETALKQFEAFKMKTRTSETLEGYLLNGAKYAVIQQTSLFMEEKDSDSYNFLGVYNKQKIEQLGVKKITAFRKYLMLVFTPDGKLVSEKPFSMRMKGNMGISWHKSLQLFMSQCEDAIAKLSKKPKMPRTQDFHALCLFQPTFEQKLLGSGNQQSMGVVVEGFQGISEANFGNHFVGFDKKIAPLVAALREGTEAFTDPKTYERGDGNETSASGNPESVLAEFSARIQRAGNDDELTNALAFAYQGSNLEAIALALTLSIEQAGEWVESSCKDRRETLMQTAGASGDVDYDDIVF